MNKEKYKHPSIDKIRFENLSFSWTFLALGVMLMLSFFPWQKKMVIDVYYLFFSVSFLSPLWRVFNSCLRIVKPEDEKLSDILYLIDQM